MARADHDLHNVNPSLSRRASLLWLLGASVGAGCGPEYVRGADDPSIDDPAMSTGLDKRDLQRAISKQMESFLEAKVAKRWAGADDEEEPVVAIYPIANETSEHIDSQLDALLSDIETFMVNNELGRIVSAERRKVMMDEIAQQQGGGFDPQARAQVNKQLGVQYFMTGKVYSSAERTEDARRVQYFLFLQLIDVSTSAVKWQNKVEITKALLK
ncbi:MAG: penicillin-binding protein activator LpoB [Myxococcota bacterium]